MSSILQSPVNRQPPPAPKARQGLLKSFNGSMLMLISSKAAETPHFETVDPERRPQHQNSRGSFLRASDLLSQGRSSASSFGSRGSFSGWFPIRPTSVPLDYSSREPSPANSPSVDSRITRSRSIAEDGEHNEQSAQASASSSIVSSMKRTLSRKIRTFTSRPSNLGKKEVHVTLENTHSLPSYISIIPPPAPTSPPVESVVPQATIIGETFEKKTPWREQKEDSKNSVSTATSASSITTAEEPDTAIEIVEEKSKDEVDTHFRKGDDHTEQHVNEQHVNEPDEEEDGEFRSEVLRDADRETIEVLTSRIGDRAAAKAVVRIARAGEAWMREETSRFLNRRDDTRIERKGSSHESTTEIKNYSMWFYGEKRPKIALDRYLGRLVRYLDNFSEGEIGIQSMGMLSLLGGIVLIDRLAARSKFNLDAMNTHRVFMVASLIAFKTLDDEPCSNEYFANVGGVELDELNALEAGFLKALEFETVLHAYDIQDVMLEFVGSRLTTELFSSWHETEII